MALSKSTRITILLVIDSLFFLLELSVGYAVHSLALVADAFHMLNDVLSLCVGLWAVKVSNSKPSSNMYTYGWQRAETLGALVNGVFLVALCVSIFLEAIQRFVEPQEVSQPKLILIVGSMGLASNIAGLFLFHDHGHGHGGHSHGHSHGHGDEIADAEEGHAHSHDHGAHDSSTQQSPGQGSDSTAVEDQAPAKYAGRRHSRAGSRYSGFDDIHVNPNAFRQSIIAASRMEDLESEDGTDNEQLADDDEDDTHNHASSHKPLLSGGHAGYGSTKRKSIDHKQHRHAQPKEQSKGGGHSHDLNMQGVFLHVLGDALGNVGVIATALFIWLTDYSWRFYMDPAISLIITAIILASAIPLLQSRLAHPPPSHLPGIVSCHHVHVWQLSDTKLVGSLHIQVEFDFKGEGSARYMDLAKAVRRCLHAYGIHSSTIQPEFCLDPEHDHSGSTDAGDEHFDSPTARTSNPASRVASKAGSVCEPDACLLECGDQCGPDKSCCAPAPSQDSHDDHDHAH
ncbi:hypothetical protein Q7P37_011627 [Cladosporium fusiforme]